MYFKEILAHDISPLTLTNKKPLKDGILTFGILIGFGCVNIQSLLILIIFLSLRYARRMPDRTSIE
jgi:hypothetical protein